MSARAQKEGPKMVIMLFLIFISKTQINSAQLFKGIKLSSLHSDSCNESFIPTSNLSWQNFKQSTTYQHILVHMTLLVIVSQGVRHCQFQKQTLTQDRRPSPHPWRR